MNRYYPEAALTILQEIGLAEKVGGDPNWLQPCEVLHTEKHMYAATKGENLIATSPHIFLLTKSSTNLLATDRQMSCSCLTHHASKVEDHAEAKITGSHDGKSFRLRSDGILNRNLSSVKHFLAQDKKRDRHIEKVDCSLLSITEGCHWLLRYPTVITNMKFVHVPNVPPGERFVYSSTVRKQPPSVHTLRDETAALEP